MARSKICLKNIKKTPVNFTLDELLFASAIKNDTEKNICNQKWINRCKIRFHKCKIISNNWRNQFERN